MHEVWWQSEFQLLSMSNLNSHTSDFVSIHALTAEKQKNAGIKAHSADASVVSST